MLFARAFPVQPAITPAVDAADEKATDT